MDIKKLIEQFNCETEEKRIADIIGKLGENCDAYLSNLSLVNSKRKLAQSLSIITRKKYAVKVAQRSRDFKNIIDELINSDDAKVRKNSYSAYANVWHDLDIFYNALDREDSYINIVHIISLIVNFDDVDMDFIKRKVDLMDKNDGNYKKAVALIDKHTASQKDAVVFTNYCDNDRLLLTSTKAGIDVLLGDIKSAGIQVQPVDICDYGIIVDANNYGKVKDIRSYYDMLIIRNGHSSVDANTKAIATYIDKLLDINYINNIFGVSRDSYAYRLEVDGDNISANDRNNLAKDIAHCISRSEFTNIRDSYDFVISIKIKGSRADIFIAPNINDRRFDYRKGALPASIHPVTASIIAGIAKKYIKNKSVVLDGFVGSGTMLYELYKRIGDANYFGVDIEKNAIDIAHNNIGTLIPNISLVKSDITEFNPKKKADIIISNLPFGTRVLRHDAILKLYDDFASRLHLLLNAGGRAFLLTTNGKAIRSSITKYGYKIIKEYRIESGGLMPYLLIIE